MRYGICSTCQSKHAVTWRRDGYYMADHNYPGTTVYCKGTGQIPEVVLGDSQAQRDTDDWDDMAMCQDYWDSWMMGRWSAYGQRQ